MRVLSAAAVVALWVGAVNAFQQPPSAPPSAPAPVQPSAPTQPAAPGQAPPPVPAPSPPAGTPPAVSSARVFGSETGMIFSAVRPEKIADFELVMGRLRQALSGSTDPIRQKQAAGWRIFKATEPGPNATVLYVFVIDPVVKGADYGVAKAIAEAFPTEAVELYKLYNGALAGGQTLLNLTPVTGVKAQGTKGP